MTGVQRGGVRVRDLAAIQVQAGAGVGTGVAFDIAEAGTDGALDAVFVLTPAVLRVLPVAAVLGDGPGQEAAILRAPEFVGGLVAGCQSAFLHIVDADLVFHVTVGHAVAEGVVFRALVVAEVPGFFGVQRCWAVGLDDVVGGHTSSSAGWDWVIGNTFHRLGCRGGDGAKSEEREESD